MAEIVVSNREETGIVNKDVEQLLIRVDSMAREMETLRVIPSLKLSLKEELSTLLTDWKNIIEGNRKRLMGWLKQKGSILDRWYSNMR